MSFFNSSRIGVLSASRAQTPHTTPRRGAFLFAAAASAVSRLTDCRTASAPHASDVNTARKARLVTRRADCFTAGLGLWERQFSRALASTAIRSSTVGNGVFWSSLACCNRIQHHSNRTNANEEARPGLDASICNFCVRNFVSSVALGPRRRERRHCWTACREDRST